MRLTAQDGTSLAISSRSELEAALATLGADGNRFAALTRADDRFIQAARTGQDRFVVEYRDGSEKAHFSSRRTSFSRAEVVGLFAAYLDGSETWRTSVEWERMEPWIFGTLRRSGSPWPTVGPRRDLAAVVAVAFALFGAGLIAWGGYEARSSRAFLERAVAGRGTVVAFERGKGRRATYYPIVQFAERDGFLRTFKGRVGTAPAQYRVGEEVVVLYDPARPSDARIGDTSSLWLAAMCVGGLGAVFCGVALLVMLRARAQGRRLAQASLHRG